MNGDIGRTLVSIGILFVVVGLIFMLLGKSGLPKLPGDIVIKKDNFVFYFPWVTSLVISVILSLLFYLFYRK